MTHISFFLPLQEKFFYKNIKLMYYCAITLTTTTNKEEVMQPYNNPKSYRNYVLAATMRNPELKKYLAKVVEYKGNGWALTPVTKCYGLTYAGIDRIVQTKKIDAVVCDTLENLTENLAKQEDGILKIITDSALIQELFSNEEKAEATLLHQHAVALISERKEKKINIFVMDSEGNSYSISDQKIRKLGENLQVLAYISRMDRQGKEKVCYTYAIQDCKRIGKFPNLLADIRKSAIRKDSHFEFVTLSKELAIGNQTACQKAVRYQQKIITNK